MAGVLRLRSSHSDQRTPRPVKRRGKPSARLEKRRIDIQSAPSSTSLPALQRACGNQAVCRLIQAQFEEDKPRRKSPAPMNIPKRDVHGPPKRMHLIYMGPTARSVPVLDQDRRLKEARKNGMAEVLGWEERGSDRVLRTREHSSAFYKWLSARIDKFPGHLALGENQYWAIDPKSGRVWLCTLHVVPAEEEERPEDQRRAREAARETGLPGAAQPGAATSEALAGTGRSAAAYISAIALLPRYIEWLSYGGKNKDPQLMVPATWYLKSIEQSKWNLPTYLGIKNLSRLMGQQAFQMAFSSSVFGKIARATGLATGQKMAALAGHEMEVLESMRAGFLLSGMPPIQVQLTLEAIQLGVLLHKLPKFYEALESNDPQALIFQTHSLVESLSALLSLQYTGISELMKGGEDDSGFYAACAKSALQRIYFTKKLLANPTALQHFLVEMKIEGREVFKAMHQILETITGTSSPILIKK